MWRFIVGLFATIGFLVLLVVGAAVVFFTTGPFGAKSLPSPIVLSLDLRRVPSKAARAICCRACSERRVTSSTPSS